MKLYVWIKEETAELVLSNEYRPWFWTVKTGDYHYRCLGEL